MGILIVWRSGGFRSIDANLRGTTGDSEAPIRGSGRLIHRNRSRHTPSSAPRPSSQATGTASMADARAGAYRLRARSWKVPRRPWNGRASRNASHRYVPPYFRLPGGRAETNSAGPPYSTSIPFVITAFAKLHGAPTPDRGEGEFYLKIPDPASRAPGRDPFARCARPERRATGGSSRFSSVFAARPPSRCRGRGVGVLRCVMFCHGDTPSALLPAPRYAPAPGRAYSG